jgi:hypothetical protein
MWSYSQLLKSYYDNVGKSAKMCVWHLLLRTSIILQNMSLLIPNQHGLRKILIVIGFTLHNRNILYVLAVKAILKVEIISECQAISKCKRSRNAKQSRNASDLKM